MGISGGTWGTEEDVGSKGFSVPKVRMLWARRVIIGRAFAPNTWDFAKERERAKGTKK